MSEPTERPWWKRIPTPSLTGWAAFWLAMAAIQWFFLDGALALFGIVISAVFLVGAHIEARIERLETWIVTDEVSRLIEAELQRRGERR